MDVQDVKKATPCPVCGGPMRLVGDAAYYDQVSRWRTPVSYCAACDLFYRDVEERRLVSHFRAASYVRKENEPQLFRSRIGFFRWILELIRNYEATAGQSGRIGLLDFGSAYGHLLRLAQEEGFEAVGIERNEDLVQACREKGLAVYQGLDEFDGKVDVITAIDSLYCVPRPRELMMSLRGKLRPGGLLVARITNRNLQAKWRSKMGREGDFSTIGDAIVSYSAKGIRRLLTLSGFRVEKVIPDYGQGKKLGLPKRLFYTATYLLTLLTLGRRILTPGIIVIATVAKEGSSATGCPAPPSLRRRSRQALNDTNGSGPSE
jgi:SAM-dependent methyltransferase